MFNEQVAFKVYNNTDAIRRSVSFENFKTSIQHGLKLLASQEQKKYMLISDMDRRDVDLALKYNIQLMNELLLQ